MKRAAIAIGVGTTGGLTPLQGAVAGAQRMAQWLRGEGFDTELLTDETEPVTVKAVEEAVTRAVDQGSYEQLVLYFAGHGFAQNLSEYWLLSGAPRSANEAIVVNESVEVARGSGIPSVVFISDACRSTMSSLRAQRVSGSLVFPNDVPDGTVKVRVDRFFAARIGTEALELAIDESTRAYDGVYTHCFLGTFAQSPAALVRDLVVNGETLHVIPNWVLEDHLRGAVLAELKVRKVARSQEPDAVIESGGRDNVYLGRAAVAPVFRGRDTGHVKVMPLPMRVAMTPTRTPTLDKVGLYRIGMLDVPSEGARAALEQSAQQSGFDAEVDELRGISGRTKFETQTGFSVRGAHVAWAAGANVYAEQEGDDVRVSPVSSRPVSSVLIQFEGGTGTVLPALRGYIGVVFVENGRVRNVAYTPAANNYRFTNDPARSAELDRLRAVAATATRHGAFRVPPDQGGELAGRIRNMKAIDPTLGVYAVYAYNTIGDDANVRSVLDFMEGDLEGGLLYDVALLAGRQPDPVADARGAQKLAPFLPMLSQGWPLLRARRGKVPAAADAASAHMLDAVWTTFDADGMAILRRALDAGELP